MEKNGIVRKYELVVILDTKSSNDEKEKIVKECVEIINKSGAKVINSQVWIEKHRMTFSIRKCSEATYYMINFEANSLVVAAIRTNLKLNEKIVRFAIFQPEGKSLVTV